MKVYNGFNFFNELDILELKLETLDSVVDYFVICESTKTHAGNPKKLYYDENKDRYKKFHNKIIHYIIKDTPQTYEDLVKIKPQNTVHGQGIANLKNAHWLNPQRDISFIRDAYEKESIMRALGEAGAEATDIVIIGDLDEVPRPERTTKVLEAFSPEKIYLMKNGSYHFYFNLEKTNEDWWGVNVLTFHNLLNNSISKLKMYNLGEKIENGGWHFSYMGGAENVIKKLESFSHQELNNPHIKNNVEHIIKSCVKDNTDILGRSSQWKIRDIEDGTFPEYLVKNREKFSKYLLEEK